MIKNKIKTQVLKVTSSLSYGGSSLFLFYKCCQYLFFPKPDEAAQIYDFSVLIMLEFFLNPCILFFQVFITHFWAKIGVVIVSSVFFLTFYFLLNDGTSMKWIMLFIILNHFIFQTKEDNTIILFYAFRSLIFFFLLFFIAIAGSWFPTQITQKFLEESNYETYKIIGGGFLDNPALSLYQGFFYYGALSFLQIFLWIKRKPNKNVENETELKLLKRRKNKRKNDLYNNK